MADSKKAPIKKPASAKPASARPTAARPASAKSASARPASAKPASRGSRAVEAVDPTLRNMRDPWFTLIVTGAKTRHVHWAEPKPAVAGRPAAPGFESLAKGDIITWRNTSLGFPRLCKVQVTLVVPLTTANVVEAVSTPAMMKAIFPTLTDVEQVKAALGGMAKSAVEKKLVVFSFKVVA